MDGVREDGDDGRKILGLAPDCDPAALHLSPAEGFLLSRIDGRTPWRLLREIGGLTPEEVDLCLEGWLARGVAVVAGVETAKPKPPPARPDRRASARAAATAAPSPAAAADEAALDPDLDIGIDVQRRILEFEARLQGSYHEILGVARDADARQIKRAYFKLSKEYHPDRYFRRKIGAYGAHLERIFKRVLEAYELLSDPATRAEVEKSLDAAPAPPSPGPAAAGRPLSKLERLRQRMPFRIPEAILNERRHRAREFFDAAQLAQEHGNYVEAASSVRLAIAFDPFTDTYKKAFAEIQAKANEMRAQRLLEQAEHSFDASSAKEALRLYEEALLLRPHDPEINAKAAELALELDQFDTAFEYAERAVEHSPEVGRYHRALARVYRAKSDAGHAALELEKALELDPGDEEARRLLSQWRPRRAARRGD
jgi:curved DNA-binding protein CbpA